MLGHVPADEQLRKQGVRPIASVDELAISDVWESDEALNEFIAYESLALI